MTQGTGKFPCTGCGACCRRVGGRHPEWVDKNTGFCVNLMPDNSCRIYETRPETCKVDVKIHNNNFFPPFATEKDYFERNAMLCKTAIDVDGMDKKFYPDLSGVEYE